MRITRVGPGTLDDDNLARSAKAVRDELAAALGADDGDPRLTWHYAQRKAKRAAVDVVIRHLPPGAPAALVVQGPEVASILLRLTAEQRRELAEGGAVDLPNATVCIVDAGGGR